MKTIEWLYTLQKSLLNKCFDQPKNAEQMRELRCPIRSDCVDAYLYWICTYEGVEFWVKIRNNLRFEDENTNS